MVAEYELVFQGTSQQQQQQYLFTHTYDKLQRIVMYMYITGYLREIIRKCIQLIGA